MKRVKLVVAYDGTNYCGWQVQPNEITVEGVLNKHISELTGEDIKVIGEIGIRDSHSAVPNHAAECLKI